MKRLNRIGIDDESIISDDFKGRNCAFREAIKAHKAVVIERYRLYIEKEANPWHINEIDIDPVAGRALKSWYLSSNDNFLSYISTVRHKLSPNCCPMCGSSHPTSVDHYLPQETYPEFAIFSPNLIPACSCNSIKQSKTRGTSPGERFINPYFDAGCGDELYLVNITGPVESPTFTIVANPASIIPEVVLNYHKTELLEKTGIFRTFEDTWGSILSAGMGYFDIDDPDKLESAIMDYAKVHQRTRGSVNNWDSMLFLGLYRSPNIVEDLRYYFETQT